MFHPVVILKHQKLQRGVALCVFQSVGRFHHHKTREPSSNSCVLSESVACLLLKTVGILMLVFESIGLRDRR